ncbi:MAG: gamma carbonic anhydrase family protein [Gammaproteobacteria bacterium]|jgi:carbonic anhydrase/acetyltransferase-like protein (isoleucine patch superfamily)|nr:gamma carbonic anhydrase family protein [Gammaproteobacteria bacterium]NDA44061.1 gamma carbonic anhydrase family protein [Gammaproteobacteria bacterium]
MIYALGERIPDIAPDAYVAPSADVIGTVRIAAAASVWFNVVLRGDSDWIEIGAGSNVQDGSVIHTDEGVPTRLGVRVTVGHMALLHCCTVGDESMIANGAMVLDRSVIGRHCLIAAGTLIPPDKQIPDGSVVMGSPGKIVREVTERDLALIRGAAASYARRAQRYRESLRACS